MKTERLYHDDPWLLEFEGRVTAAGDQEGRAWVALDRTAFHPTGGGQPHDTGTLEGWKVVDVVPDESGRVLHVLEGEGAPGIGQLLRGRVDGARRRDHLQQHSGQHLLSAAFVRAREAATRSFHLGARTSTIDLDRLPEDLGDPREVEDLANAVIAEDRPMSARVVDEAEARELPLRKELAVTGRVRIVSIEGFDLTPCGGTHARHSGEIGMLAILGWERHRGGTRVEFVAGERVRRVLHDAVDELREVGARLSAPRGQRVEALERLLEERRQEARRTKDLALRAARLEAASMVPEARGGVLARLVEDRTRAEIDCMARGLADAGVVAVLGWVEGDAGRVIVASPGSPPAGDLLRAVAGDFGARGGGNPRFAQAGGMPPASLPRLLEALDRHAREAS